MIIAQNVGAGTYGFFWEGGPGGLDISASTWGGGAATLNFQDDFGNWHFCNSWSSNNNFGNGIGLNGSAMAGNYQIVVAGSVSGFSAQIRRAPQ